MSTKMTGTASREITALDRHTGAFVKIPAGTTVTVRETPTGRYKIGAFAGAARTLAMDWDQMIARVTPA